ncbi:uncharacterized protein LOC62_05G007167 [Vanrija pseudolonga]|uniref:54S ribosomal protein L27, mitochondrial n=1 Tax=Vanrija pseudolonga TaxID=143232 RepID=A0AAF0YBY1_9TREE|nr:hypothetical protein LOC62_05G007167 [Vanrija pseudolonga]
MRPTTSLLGASRLPLTPKRGNKDYYKGTRQAYAPGGGHRTGPPGKHVVKGTAKYRVVDSQVRVFVGPGIEKIEASALKPYATTTRYDPAPLRLPPFGPAPPKKNGLKTADYKAFSANYAALSLSQRQALIMEQRRKWWSAFVQRFPEQGVEEEKTRAVEEQAQAKA